MAHTSVGRHGRHFSAALLVLSASPLLRSVRGSFPSHTDKHPGLSFLAEVPNDGHRGRAGREAHMLLRCCQCPPGHFVLAGSIPGTACDAHFLSCVVPGYIPMQRGIFLSPVGKSSGKTEPSPTHKAKRMGLSPAVVCGLSRGIRERIASACNCSVSRAPSGSRLTDHCARFHCLHVFHSFHRSPSALTSPPCPSATCPEAGDPGSRWEGRT